MNTVGSFLSLQSSSLLQYYVTKILLSVLGNIRVTDHYFLSVENIGINLESSTEEDETTNIKKVCKPHRSLKLEIYFDIPFKLILLRLFF